MWFVMLSLGIAIGSYITVALRRISLRYPTGPANFTAPEILAKFRACAAQTPPDLALDLAHAIKDMRIADSGAEILDSVKIRERAENLRETVDALAHQIIVEVWRSRFDS